MTQPIIANDAEEADDRKVFHIRMRPSVYNRARKQAKSEGIPIAKVIEQCVESSLELIT